MNICIFFANFIKMPLRTRLFFRCLRYLIDNIMIVEFSVKNFRSIQDLQTISFKATGLSSAPKNSEVDRCNIFTDGGEELLKVVGLYGPNASGKTNLIKALEYFCQIVGALPSPESRLSRLSQPFLYQENSIETESYFQMVLIINGKKYRYGFTIRKNVTDDISVDNSSEVITNEWLFGPKGTKQGKYFVRSGLNVESTSYIKSNNIAPLEYEHSLFLTHVASYNKGICADIRNKIRGFTTPMFRSRSDFYRFHSIRQIETAELKENFLEFLRSFGLDYDDIYYQREKVTKERNEFTLSRLFLEKSIYDNKD